MDFRSPVSTDARFGRATDGLFSDNFDIQFIGAVPGQLIALGFSNLAQNATFVSATFVSILIGAIGAADRCGRRLMFQFNLAVFGLATLARAVSLARLGSQWSHQAARAQPGQCKGQPWFGF